MNESTLGSSPHGAESMNEVQPPKPLNVGIIGVGGVSEFHFAGYRSVGADITAAADLDPQTLEAKMTRWRVPRGYRDYRELLDDEEVEAVSICLPNALHHPATLAAARVGKHVLCEKPISPSLEQAREMITACRRAGVVLQIDHQLRAEAAVIRAREMIASGVLGRVTFLRLRQAHDWGGRPTVPGSFGRRSSSGGGTLLDNGCHLMDLARFLAGEVHEIYARMATLKFDIEVEDTAAVSLIFDSGALGVIETAWTATGWEQGFWVYGTKGALEFTNRFGKPRLRHLHRESNATTWSNTDLTTFEFADEDAHTGSIRAFLEAIRGRRQVICSGEDGMEALRLVLASYRSAEENRAVTL